MRNRFIFKEGFTLIEVMLALAIVSVGIIAILGLLPVGLRAGRDAADNTLSATVVQDTFSGLRTNAFHSAILCDTCITPQDLSTYDTTTTPSLRVSNAYDQAGFSTGWTNAYYKVMLDFQPQAPLPLSQVTATVVWPAQSKNPVNTNVFITRIAQYD
jgi:prepilin-type N-terminal cleavage/methylation domain-containing protein